MGEVFQGVWKAWQLWISAAHANRWRQIVHPAELQVHYMLRVATDGGAAPTEPPNGEGVVWTKRYIRPLISGCP
jgi:hypothetical protein